MKIPKMMLKGKKDDGDNDDKKKPAGKIKRSAMKANKKNDDNMTGY